MFDGAGRLFRQSDVELKLGASLREVLVEERLLPKGHSAGSKLSEA